MPTTMQEWALHGQRSKLQFSIQPYAACIQQVGEDGKAGLGSGFAQSGSFLLPG